MLCSSVSDLLLISFSYNPVIRPSTFLICLRYGYRLLPFRVQGSSVYAISFPTPAFRELDYHSFSISYLALLPISQIGTKTFLSSEVILDRTVLAVCLRFPPICLRLSVCLSPTTAGYLHTFYIFIKVSLYTFIYDILLFLLL